MNTSLVAPSFLVNLVSFLLQYQTSCSGPDSGEWASASVYYLSRDMSL